jgi:hypothetical protein
MWLYQHGNDSMLSRKKGRRYGEGHQKALQISVCMLPLVSIRRREGAIFLPGFRAKRNTWRLFMNAFAALWLGKCSSSHTMAVTGRDVMVYLVTKRLKCPLQRSFDEGGYVVGGATAAYQ